MRAGKERRAPCSIVQLPALSLATPLAYYTRVARIAHKYTEPGSRIGAQQHIFLAPSSLAALLCVLNMARYFIHGRSSSSRSSSPVGSVLSGGGYIREAD